MSALTKYLCFFVFAFLCRVCFWPKCLTFLATPWCWSCWINWNRRHVRNEIYMYYIHHAVTVTWPTSTASLPFINLLLWPNGMIKCPSNAHFRILVEVVGHPGNFLPTVFWKLISDTLLTSHTVFCILCSREVCDFFSLSVCQWAAATL